MQSFFISLNAVLPIVLMVLLGLFLKKKNLLDPHTFEKLNHMCFRYFLPCLLYSNIINNNIQNSVNIKLMIFTVVAVFLIIVVSWIAVFFVEKDKKKIGSMVQAIYRTNYVILGIPLSYSLYGDKGVAVTSMMIAVVIPVYNILAVIILAVNGTEKADFKKIFINIIKNPLIISASLAIITILSGINLPVSIKNTVSNIGKIGGNLPIVLLGASLSAVQVKDNFSNIVFATVFRLVIIPALIILAAVHAGFRDAVLVCIITIFATPSAISSAIMAQEMGCDGDLAAQLVVFTSVFSAFTIFCFIFILDLYKFI